MGTVVATILSIIASYFIITGLISQPYTTGGATYTGTGVFVATVAGLLAGFLIGKSPSIILLMIMIRSS
jgi:K(+)-stimulated pyrophosphate-energized sodium pump